MTRAKGLLIVGFLLCASMAAWSAQITPAYIVDLASRVTGTLPIGNGGTGITSCTDNQVVTGGTTLTCESALTFDGTSLVTSGVGPHAVGLTADTVKQLALGGSFTGASSAYGLYMTSTLIPAANGDAAGMVWQPTLNKAGSGTHGDFASTILYAPTIGAGASTLTNSTTLKIMGAPSVGTNLRALWIAAGLSQFDGGIKGSATNDAATAGNIGELFTATVAVGSQVTLTTATSANVVTLTNLTAGDWDCNGQVTHNAAGTTSITLLQIGISATSATLPTQAGGSGIGTDPLAIWRQAAGVPAGALTTAVGPVRVSLAGTTTIYLVANDTFTVAGMQAYGTIRCRRMR